MGFFLNQQFTKMPGTHAADKEPFSALIHRTLHYRLRKAAHRAGVDMSVMVAEILEERFGHITLSPADLQLIENATRLAERTRRRVATPFILPEEELQDRST